MNNTVFILVIFILVGGFSFLLARAVGSRFDERQLRVQGKAYRISFLTLVTSLCVYLLCAEVNDGSIGTFGVWLCLILSVLVFAVYCIWNDAFFQVHQKPALYFIVCVMNIAVHVLNVIYRPVDLHDLEHSPSARNLLVALLFGAVVVTIALNLLRERRGDSE